MENRIDAFLTLMHELGASDLCISTGHRVTARISGAIEALRYPPISEDGFRRMIIPILRQGQWDRFDETGDLDLAYEVPNVARFRVNLFKHQDGYGSVFRSIPTKILSMRDLSFPDAIARIPHFRSGLALITGPTGSGKSTTLAAIIHEINLTKPQHIITIEDPLEFVHQNRRCRFSQREIGTHAQSFSDALRSAIREDPDVVLVGELRDLETIRMALKAAETGLLVFSTLHTNTAIKTVDRVVTVFSSEEQESVRRVLADSLRAVVSQQLIPKIGGGRVAAHEILFGSPALGALIREGKTSQIINLIQTGRNAGMIDMDTAILNLVQSGVIEPSHAFEKSINKDKFKKKLDALIPTLKARSGGQPQAEAGYERIGSSASARRPESSGSRRRPAVDDEGSRRGESARGGEGSSRGRGIDSSSRGRGFERDSSSSRGHGFEREGSSSRGHGVEREGSRGHGVEREGSRGRGHEREGSRDPYGTDERRSADRRSGDRRSAERRSAERRTSERRSGDRRTSERGPDRRSPDRRSAERRGAERGESTRRRPPDERRDASRKKPRPDGSRPRRPDERAGSRGGGWPPLRDPRDPRKESRRRRPPER